jgi:polyisoprenyl-phosphate glycosyltransferase
MSGAETILVITAIYNDWPALSQLLLDLEKTFATDGTRFHILVVDDASTVPRHWDFKEYATGKIIKSVTLLDLRSNVGNQFAIAAGLRYAMEHCACDKILVMDADGEDRLSDAKLMIQESRLRKDSIIVGQRTKRSESGSFKLFYFLYQTIFRTLTGRRIAFGNFSVIPKALAHPIANRPELPHHYSATLLRTRLPIVEIPTTRGRRYAGDSHMNMPGLVFHALAAFSVFSDALFSRVLIAAASIVGICAAGIVAVAYLRFFTTVAFPNWATTVISFLALLASQAILLVLSSAFILLTGRSSMLMASFETSRIIGQVRNFEIG